MFLARLGLAVAAVTLIASCAAGSDGSDSGSLPAAMGGYRAISSEPAARNPSIADCGSKGHTGFSISLPAGISGSPDPRAAVQAFETGGEHPGYGSVDTRWTVITGKDGDTFSDGHGVSLTVVRLPDATWIVDSGEGCS